MARRKATNGESGDLQRFLEHLKTVRARRTMQTYACCLHQFARYLTARKLTFAAVPPTVLQDYAEYLGQHDRQPATIALHVAAVRAYLEWVGERGGKVEVTQKCKLPRIQRRLPPILDDAEIARYIGAARALEEPQATALIVLPLTGLRAGELCALQLADVEWSLESRAWVLHIHDGKSKRDRMVPVLASGGPILAHYFSLVRPRLDTSKMVFPGLTYRKLLDTVGRLAKQERLPKISPHCLRHTYASALARSGLDIDQIARILGHSNISTATIYVHRTVKDLCASLRAVDAPWARVVVEEDAENAE